MIIKIKKINDNKDILEKIKSKYECIYHNLITYINKDSPLRINGEERIIKIDEQKRISKFLTEISKYLIIKLKNFRLNVFLNFKALLKSIITL